MALQILTTVYGQKHIELFKKTALKSLAWERNAAALNDIGTTWNIFTDEEEMLALSEYCIKTLSRMKVSFNVMPRSLLRNYIDEVQSASIWQMEQALAHKARVLLAPPDTIFGDGTVEGLLRASEEEGSVVVVPHPRVLPSILDPLESLPLPLGNAPLVNWAWAHLHDSWVHAEKWHPNQSSFVGGVTWWRAGNVIQGTHVLPSPYMINFTEEDLMYFKAAISMGHWDHMWPGDILLPRGRQRYLASSDAAFVVEITEADKNIPPIIENQPKTGFWRDHVHNKANAQIIFTFRGS